MATSSNFGNTLSTAIGSLILPFLPMLPSQILLNNLLYDMSEMTIPTDNVDPEQLVRPAHWDMGLIRRFMLVFGPVSSLGDISIFTVMLFMLHAGRRRNFVLGILRRIVRHSDADHLRDSHPARAVLPQPRQPPIDGDDAGRRARRGQPSVYAPRRVLRIHRAVPDLLRRPG